MATTHMSGSCAPTAMPDAMQLQLTMGPFSGNSRGGEEIRPSSLQAPRGRALWRRAVDAGKGGAAAGDAGAEATCSPWSPTPSSSTAYGGVAGPQWAMSSLPSWTAS
ncbi:hypothetical protein ZWY2020_014254 [Hordeum vulgare]|nr:hypothetical protein ZWY2020_014254 [Hordeum vulgare]